MKSNALLHSHLQLDQDPKGDQPVVQLDEGWLQSVENISHESVTVEQDDLNYSKSGIEDGERIKHCQR